MVVEAHYSEFNQADLDFQKELGEWCRRKIHEVDEHAKKLAGKQLTTYLTGQNHEIASHCNAKAKELLFDLMTQGTELSKLTFKMDPNLQDNHKKWRLGKTLFQAAIFYYFRCSRVASAR